MGKALVKLGLWLQRVWRKTLCKWNWLVSKLIIEVKECPVSQCLCKNKIQFEDRNKPLGTDWPKYGS